jgi:hypothetical protein
MGFQPPKPDNKSKVETPKVECSWLIRREQHFTGLSLGPPLKRSTPGPVRPPTDKNRTVIILNRTPHSR